MRISDWSSDVCSSDLLAAAADDHAAGNAAAAVAAGVALVIVGTGMDDERRAIGRSEEHTSELQSLMRISYAVFCLKKKKKTKNNRHPTTSTLHNIHNIATKKIEDRYIRRTIAHTNIW